MNNLDCELICTNDEGTEITVGHASVQCVPRVGEVVWFSDKRHGCSAWQVEEVCHWVGNGEYAAYPNGYQKIALYVMPVN